jgi:organic hydroperoxide reductase OsmC/OhrA
MSEPAEVLVRLEQAEDYSFRLTFPGTELDTWITDESAPLGADRGPNPSRLLLAAIGNCLAASLLFALRKHKNSPGALVAEVSAKPMRNAEGFLRLPQVAVELTIPGQSQEFNNLERVLDQFENFCTVTQSVRQGIDVQLTVKDGDGRVLRGDKTFEAGA